jgi:hypothetical protein
MKSTFEKNIAAALMAAILSAAAGTAGAEGLIPTKVVRTNVFTLSQTAVSLDIASIAYISSRTSGPETNRAGVGYSAAIVGGLLMMFSVYDMVDSGYLVTGGDPRDAFTAPINSSILGATTLGLGLAALFPEESAIGEVVDQVLAARVSVSPSMGTDSTGAPAPGLDVSILL